MIFPERMKSLLNNFSFSKKSSDTLGTRMKKKKDKSSDYESIIETSRKNTGFLKRRRLS